MRPLNFGLRRLLVEEHALTRKGLGAVLLAYLYEFGYWNQQKRLVEWTPGQ